jgi:ABC-type glycerol-3-phosphate transport system substrate-binding protein
VPVRLVVCVSLAWGCGSEPVGAPAIRFLHTFSPEETELFNAVASERKLAVEASRVPFARGQQVIGEILSAGRDCPDLIRIDATWLPGMADLLSPVPDALAKLDWTPEAQALVTFGAGIRAVPQTVDGLVVIRDRARPAPSSPAIADLVAASRAARTQTTPYPLGLRVDGYWFVPWLRAEGGELAVTGIESEGATRAIVAFAQLFGEVAPPPPPAGSEAPDEVRRWHSGELAYWVTGPWQLGTLRDRDRVAITALARAPRGGQLLVVPKCAQRPAEGWRLASELSEVAVAHRFADAFGTVPTRTGALTTAAPLARALYEALRTTEPLPQTPHTPLLFDDLNPALAAVVAGDATPDEVIAGVRRGWKRLVRGPP